MHGDSNARWGRQAVDKRARGKPWGSAVGLGTYSTGRGRTKITNRSRTSRKVIDPAWTGVTRVRVGWREAAATALIRARGPGGGANECSY